MRADPTVAEWLNYPGQYSQARGHRAGAVQLLRSERKVLRQVAGWLLSTFSCHSLAGQVFFLRLREILLSKASVHAEADLSDPFWKYQHEYRSHIGIEAVQMYGQDRRSVLEPDFERHGNTHLDTWLKGNFVDKFRWVTRLLDEPDWMEHEDSGSASFF